MNGFDFCVKVFEVDINPRVCFMSSGLINQEALREQYPSLSIVLNKKAGYNRVFS